MTSVIVSTGRRVARFDPKAALVADAQADAIIEYAKRVKDWPLLERAVDEKMENQREFVEWWRENVTPNKARKSVGADRRSQMTKDAAEERAGITHQQVSKWAKRLAKPEEYRSHLYAAAYQAAMAAAKDAHVAHNSGQNEWYTPAQFIEAARRTMGGIDLDPASTRLANRTVKAERIFTKADDGLKREWNGRVWMNPPYAQPLCSRFCELLLAKYGSREIEQACVLVNNATETTWFQPMLTACAAVLFPLGRVRFIDQDGEASGSPLQGQALLYFGENSGAFGIEFGEYGVVL